MTVIAGTAIVTILIKQNCHSSSVRVCKVGGVWRVGGVSSGCGRGQWAELSIQDQCEERERLRLVWFIGNCERYFSGIGTMIDWIVGLDCYVHTYVHMSYIRKPYN